MAEHGTTEHFEHLEHAEHAAHTNDNFTTKVSITVAILAVLAASVGSLETIETAGVTVAKNEAVLLQNKATDAWNFFQAKSMKKNMYEIAAATGGPKAEDFAKKYQAREEDGVPVVKPPAGADVYLLGRTFQWWPILELEKGQSYRIHLSSLDLQHGFSLQPTNINIQVHPGLEHIITLTPTADGTFGIICNEYCGLGHHTMTGKIYVTQKKVAEGGAVATAAAKIGEAK